MLFLVFLQITAWIFYKNQEIKKIIIFYLFWIHYIFVAHWQVLHSQFISIFVQIIETEVGKREELLH